MSSDAVASMEVRKGLRHTPVPRESPASIRDRNPSLQPAADTASSSNQLVLPPLSNRKSGQVTSISTTPVLANRQPRSQHATQQSPRSAGRPPDVASSPNNNIASLDGVPSDLLLSLVRQHRSPSSLATAAANIANGNSAEKKSRKPNVVTVSKPAAAWNYPAQRARFKHLTDQPVCFCGAGKDVSFLYDSQASKAKESKGATSLQLAAVPETPTAASANIQQSPMKADLSQSLIPNDYHVVKTAGVFGVDIYDSEHTTHAIDHPRHPVAFPSLHPVGRQQVIALKETMAEMLRSAGLDDAGLDVSGPTHIHKLLKLIKKEQDIYNVCFHEVIRQVSVECVERGQILADIRDRYSKLLSKIPEQVLGLHEELLAQRSLDRQLVSELQRFELEVGRLSTELRTVHYRDDEVRQETLIVKDELSMALEESQKNANLLKEYHELYELQRRRLEFQIEKLTAEKDLWQEAAHGLAFKVTDEQSLQSCQRLQLCEKCWYKLAMHFGVLLSDNDLQQISGVQEHVHQWQKNVVKFSQFIDGEDNSFLRRIAAVKTQMKAWSKRMVAEVMVEDGALSPLTDEPLEELKEDLKSWETTITALAERFGGNSVVEAGEKMEELRKSMSSWDEIARILYGRHRQEDGSPHQHLDQMINVNQAVSKFHQRLAIRISGENGVADRIIHLVSPLETWFNKVNAAVQTGRTLTDSEWIKFQSVLYEWQHMITDTALRVGTETAPTETSASEADNVTQFPETVTPTDPSNLISSVRTWMSESMNALEVEDSRILQQVADLHGELVHWTVKLLLELTKSATDKERDRKQDFTVKLYDKAEKEGKDAVPEVGDNNTVTSLRIKCQMLTNQVYHFTRLLFRCCSDVIQQRFTSNPDFTDIDDDEDYKDLQRLQSESEDWLEMSELLLSQVDAVLHGLAPTSAITSVADTAASKGAVEKRPKPASTAEQTASTEQQKAAATTQPAVTLEMAACSNDKSFTPVGEAVVVITETSEVPVNVIGVDDNVHPRKLDAILPPEELRQDTPVTPLQADAALPKSEFGVESEAFAAAVEEMREKASNWEQRCVSAEARADASKLEVEKLTKQLEELQQKMKESPKISQRRSNFGRRDDRSRGSNRPPSGVRK